MVLHGPLFIYCLCSGLKTAAIDIGCNTFTEHKINAYNRLHFLHICSDCCRHLNGLAITLHHKTTKAPTFAPRHSVKLNFGLKYNDILSQRWLSCLFCRSSCFGRLVRYQRWPLFCRGSRERAARFNLSVLMLLPCLRWRSRDKVSQSWIERRRPTSLWSHQCLWNKASTGKTAGNKVKRCPSK